jgi:hypothetical protein
MKCPKCGREYGGGKAFCDVDGSFLVAGDAGAVANEPDALRPGIATPLPVPEDDIPPPPVDLNSEITQQAPPRMVEPIEPAADDDPNARLRAADVTIPAPRHRLNVPLPPRGAPVPPQYAPARPHPPAKGSNPWKVAFLAMIGVLAIGGILFWLLRNNPNAQNTNTPPLTADPNGSPVVPASPPTGADETNVPTVATPPPYTDANVNAPATPTPMPLETPVNANLPPPDNSNLPPPSPTPRNSNGNSNNNNSPGGTPPATPRPSPGAAATPRPNPTARPTQPAGPPR